MPNPLRAKDTINLQITMAGLARVHDRYLRGMQHGLVLGDELQKDYNWISELERILLGSGYLSREEIRKRHLLVNEKWKPEFDVDVERIVNAKG
jgi:hypothetical protein